MPRARVELPCIGLSTVGWIVEIAVHLGMRFEHVADCILVEIYTAAE